MLPSGRGSFPDPIKPARLEEFELQAHQNPSWDRDWPAEIRGYYRDLIKSIPAQKERYRLALPERQVRKNIRQLFEEGPKLTDPGALRHRALMISADLEEYFRMDYFDTHVIGKYNCLDTNAILKKDLAAATSETQAAHRFFNEGTNVLLETGVGMDDVTENRVYMTREEAYKKGIAALKGADIVSHFLPALDSPNKATLESIANEVNLAQLLDTLAATPVSDSNSAEDYVSRSAAFHQAAGLQEHKASGGVVLKAWEQYKDAELNAAVLTHPAYKALISDPKRNVLLRGPADWVQLDEAQDAAAAVGDRPSESEMKVAKHLYHSDQMPEGYGADLGVSYLADMKGIDRRMDLLVDQEIEYRQEQLLKIQAHTAECMKSKCTGATTVAALTKQLDTLDWASFYITADGAAPASPALAL